MFCRGASEPSYHTFGLATLDDVAESYASNVPFVVRVSFIFMLTPITVDFLVFNDYTDSAFTVVSVMLVARRILMVNM